MRSNQKLRLVFVALVAFAAPSLAADPPAPSAGEEDAILAAAHAETWREPDAAGFVRALRKAIAGHDATATALLVQFPLHLNHEDGIVTALENARALEARFDEAFPPELRAILAKTGDADWWLKAGPDDLGIANGLLWAQLAGHEKTHHYLLKTVNLPDPKSDSAGARRLKGLQFTCQTEKHHIAIDAAGGEKVRYRAWNKPHFPPDAPDVEVVGTWDYEGTGACTHRIWSFPKGETTYGLEELGCSAGAGGGPPDDAKAELDVVVSGKLKRTWWCY